MKTLKQYYTCCYFIGGSYYASNVTCRLTPSEAQKTNESERGAKCWLLVEDYKPLSRFMGAVRCDGVHLPYSSADEYLKDYAASIRQGVSRGLQLMNKKHERLAA